MTEEHKICQWSIRA